MSFLLQNILDHFEGNSTGNIKQLCGKMKIFVFMVHFSHEYKLVTQLQLPSTNDISIFTRQIADE